MVAVPPEEAEALAGTWRAENSSPSASDTGRGSGIGGAAGADAGRETGRGGRDTGAVGMVPLGGTLPVPSGDEEDCAPNEAAANSKAVVVSDGVEDVAA